MVGRWFRLKSDLKNIFTRIEIIQLGWQINPKNYGPNSSLF